MAALPQLITVEQFREMPEDGDFVYELHNGEVVAMTRPRPVHYILQRGLARLLERKLAAYGEAFVELPFRAVPQFDFRVADVALVSHARFAALDREDDLRGAPELVIEVLSPSNTKTKLPEMVSLCLNNGALECWLVDPLKRSVTVFRKDATSAVYEEGATIPLAAFGSDDLPVAEIFRT